MKPGKILDAAIVAVLIAAVLCIAAAILAGCATLRPDAEKAQAMGAVQVAADNATKPPKSFLHLRWKKWIGPETLSDGKQRWTRAASIDGRPAETLLYVYRYASPNAASPFYWQQYAGDVAVLRSMKTFATLDPAKRDCRAAFDRFWNFARESAFYLDFDEPLDTLLYKLYGWEIAP
jgi:hypothetical protein